jgi:hypothetical protein
MGAASLESIVSITSSVGAAGGDAARAQKSEVSLVRLYVLRATYLLMVAGLGAYMWPALIANAQADEISPNAVRSLLCAVSVLAVLGLRYPLQMLPLMLFELIWKTIWLLAVALPMQLRGQIDADVAGSVFDCATGVIFLIAIPWPYVWRHYVVKPGDRWR